MAASKFKFKVGTKVYFNSLPYEVSEQKETDTGRWYLLLNRIGYVHETELKSSNKR